MVKTSVLNAYELLPEVYRQKFRESAKEEMLNLPGRKKVYLIAGVLLWRSGKILPN